MTPSRAQVHSYFSLLRWNLYHSGEGSLPAPPRPKLQLVWSDRQTEAAWVVAGCLALAGLIVLIAVPR